MPLLAVFALILLIYLSRSGNIQNWSLNARIGTFSLILGIILRGGALFLGASGDSFSDSPPFFATVLFFASGLAFVVTIVCLIVGLYRIFFEKY
ncbi:hypothetical protein [Mesobacillus subterraneus]|uniref:Uncharacterized protein n=1 Tax=Mesobacillus subterraneus TaxID=285983 RepID=A0A3R9DLX8_9BACI|nr:hypothetical protein [Mesobacillus subterraneus]RSD21092.1 hypothetical protein EJA10_22605 [Mesobacillus subterraneus]